MGKHHDVMGAMAGWPWCKTHNRYVDPDRGFCRRCWWTFWTGKMSQPISMLFLGASYGAYEAVFLTAYVVFTMIFCVFQFIDEERYKCRRI